MKKIYISDIFSWLPAKEMSLEEIGKIVKDAADGISHEGYAVQHNLPSDANENIIEAMRELIQEGKRVCFLLRENQIISVIGYR